MTAGPISETEIVARHEAALARIERGPAAAVASDVRDLLAAARRAGLAGLLPHLRLTMAWVELDSGRPAAGLRQLRAAAPSLTGAPAARAGCLRGLHLTAAGRHAAAHAELTNAIAALRAHGDQHWLANALVARGTAGGYLLRLAEADADYAEAAALYARLGERVRAAACRHNRGFVALRAGDLPAALHWFRVAVRAGLPVERFPEALVDRAQALLAAGLAGEARPLLVSAAAGLSAAGRGTKLAEALLVLAQCALRAGAFEVARTAADRAARLFGGQRRPGWRAAARAVALTATLTSRAAPAARVHRIAAECDRHGWQLAAAELRLAAATATTDATDARHWLTRVAAHRHRGPAGLRIVGWLARARLAALSGDGRGAAAACRAGLRLVERYAAALGAWELRAGAAALATDLAGLGLDVVIAGGRPAAVLHWADRYRASALRGPAILPPTNPELAEALATLRTAVAEQAESRRVVELEDRVRALDWARPGARGVEATWRIDEVADALDDTALLSFADHNGLSFVLSVVDGQCRRHRLGPTPDIAEPLRALRFAVPLGERGTPRARHAAAELDRRLLDPVRPVIGDRPLVVVPTAAAHALPWGALPSCHDRPVSVAPSVYTWYRAVRAAVPTDFPAQVWISGPGLAQAKPEVRALHAAHGGRLLTGIRSTVDDVLAAMDGADTVHIAAHGEFRADSPLFSRLDLADGPLYGYDVHRLRRAPRRIVLSACEVGRSAVRPGDEPIGLAAALLGCGSATVIASVLPVPDESAAPVMAALHAGLRAGHGPAAALATAQARHGQLGFVCFGAG